jgi:hypothetical protein
MAEITAYPVGTPTASDLVLGTELADPNVAGDTNKTRNFTIQQITDIATNTGTLGYTLYSGIISQVTGAPTVTVLQNTITGTMTWARTSAGVYTVTNSGTPFTNLKTMVFVNVGDGEPNQMIMWTRTSSSVITLKTNGADDRITAGALEIRVYS